MTTSEKNKIMRSIAVYLVGQIMARKKCSRDEAVEILMYTTVYEALMDSETDLYLESKEAVMDILQEEMDGNPYRLLAI